MELGEAERRRAEEELAVEMFLPPFFLLVGALTTVAVFLTGLHVLMGYYVAAVPLSVSLTATLLTRFFLRRRIAARYGRAQLD